MKVMLKDGAVAPVLPFMLPVKVILNPPMLVSVQGRVQLGV